MVIRTKAIRTIVQKALGLKTQRTSATEPPVIITPPTTIAALNNAYNHKHCWRCWHKYVTVTYGIVYKTANIMDWHWMQYHHQSKLEYTLLIL